MAFFDFLTGADEAQKAAAKATKQSLAYATEGRDKAADVLRPGANFAPVQGTIDRYLGLEGPQAQQDAFGAFVESPEVAFYREQGEEAAKRGAAAGGNLMSGRTLSALTDFGQKMARTSFGDHIARLFDRYKTGLGTAGGLASTYSGSGNTLANLQMQGGMQQADYAGQRGGVFGDLLSQGAALGAYMYGARPGSTGTSYAPDFKRLY